MANTLRGTYADLGPLRVYYEVHGPSRDDAPPVLLLHGGDPTIETSFGAILPLLARTRRAIAFERQGHGHTADVPGRPTSFADSARDAAALLDRLGVDRVDVVGYSNGGHVAIQLALDHPARVDRLVVISAMASRDGAAPEFWAFFDHPSIEAMPRDIRDAYLASAPRPEDLPRYFAASVNRMRDFRGWSADELRSIRAPTLLLLGDRDIVTPQHAVWLYRLLPDARLCIVPDTDHAAIVRRTDVVLPAVDSFLSRE
jgi:pimeloyl-ACP methyl ester carboxylesterase